MTAGFYYLVISLLDIHQIVVDKLRLACEGESMFISKIKSTDK
jgi:hypothetical protein